MFLGPDSAAPPEMACFFRKIGDLDAGRPKAVAIDPDPPDVPYGLRSRLSYFLMVFCGGLEIHSNMDKTPAVFLRRLELYNHAQVRADYLAKFSRGDHALQQYLVFAPLLPEGVDRAALPKSVTAAFDVDEDGRVQKLELQEPLPEPVRREVRRAVRAWLFLPRIKGGVPVTTNLRIPIVLGASGG
ncbi:MAG TPA: energy transducer TonB [Opitutaceae bacterium]|nr:energy transducer TonB [Opitutaceae bacterium]